MATRHRVYDHLVKSFPANHPAKMAPLLTALNNGVKLIDNIEAQKAEMVKAGKLTPSGIAEALAGHAKQSIAGLREARYAALSVKQEATARRAEIKPSIKDPQNVAAALDRQEIRRVIREAGNDRAKILQANDPRIMEAVLTAAPVLSGISDALHKNLVDSFAETTASYDISEINELENAADAVLAALNEARSELQTLLGLDPVPFNQLAAPIEVETDTRMAPKPDPKPDPEALKSEFARLSHKERSAMIDNLFTMQADTIGEKLPLN
jgi:hypothetical protein